MAKKLEVRNLTISFRTINGAVHAVRDVSFDLEEGETLAIAGESGSGKSVTNRAIMGILAGNAMVDDGEIIYDGRDLLKIPEEEFHTLRGHKLSMVFQDPLSALNPIMRIGRQLTEAMLLNNKERRADGKERFNSMLATLEKNMTAAGVANAKEKCKELNSFTLEAVRQENAYQTARERAVSLLDSLEEYDNAVLARDKEKTAGVLKTIARESGEIKDPYVLSLAGGPMSISGADELPSLKEKLLKATDDHAVQPNFFRIGYLVTHGGSADPLKESIDSINQKAGKALDDGFMLSFLKDVKEALAYSAAHSERERAKAVDVLKTEQSVFAEKELNIAKCKASVQKCANAVENAIDPLALEKDNRAYVFRSSMEGYIDRYAYGLKKNPQELKRFDKDTVKHDKLAAQGKFAPSVIPLNLVDMDKTRSNMTGTVSQLMDHFAQKREEKDLDQCAVDIIDYLKDRASDYAYHLSKGMARHRAIELMKEVGIPEPEKRYRQYPFEFSGGMRQRIVIAIALSANPDILICDEPTTALDVTIQAQILELINRLKKQRKLSVIFITHDLGVVANMADKIAIMYAGKIVEYGTADEVFYDPRHPYTWALLASMPDLETKEKLDAIPGTPPDMLLPPKGDAFAARNQYALEIDFEEQPPMFHVSPTHWAATWLLHPDAPKQDPPAIVTDRIRRMLAMSEKRPISGDNTEIGNQSGQGGDQA